MTAVLSVDLGTSNTVAVLAAHGRAPRLVEIDGAPSMPSAIFATDDGHLVAGREAERRARTDPARFEPNPKRRVDEGTLLLGTRVAPVTEALATVLARVAGEVSRQLGDTRPDEVRLTHPAQWGPVRRNVLLSAARQAGLGTNLVLVPEPVAAAAHFASFPGRSLAPGQALVVYDLGAGTFDVAAVGATQPGFTVLAEAGLPDLGGLDVDQALLTHIGRQVAGRDPAGWQRLMVPASVTDRRAQRALREDVRAAKEALSGHPQTEVPLPEQFGDVLVTRVELEALVRPDLLRSVQLLADTVRRAGLTPDRLAGVYLVGGSSRIPLAAALIADQLRIVPTNLDQPESAVALGAHHVPREGISLRTADLPAGPPAQPAPVRPQPATAARPPAPVPRRRPWWLAVAGVLAAAIVTAVVLVVNSNDGRQTGATPTTTTDPTTTADPTTTTTVATTGPSDVVVGHPKKAPTNDECASLLTAAEAGAVLGTSVTVSTDDPCHLQANHPGEEPGDVRMAVTSHPAGVKSKDYEGNSSFLDQEPVTYIDTDGGGGTWPRCKVLLAVATREFIAVEVVRRQEDAPRVCDTTWQLVKVAFDKLPDA